MIIVTGATMIHNSVMALRYCRLAAAPGRQVRFIAHLTDRFELKKNLSQ
jgi:hypothetical protein